MKRCYKCGKTLLKKQFSKDPSKKDRLHGKCKKCCSDYNYKTSQKRWRRYGISFTIEDYNILLDKQNNKCAVCHKLINNGARRLAVDHNHENGKIRGLLCGRCNLGLGLFDDSIKILNSAINYLGQ